jgi:DNA-binding response OmpR family regulator
MDTQKTILIVEDDQSLLRILTDELMKAGFVVLEAKDGAQGYRMAIDSKPDIILLDILMPILDGISMLQKLREDEIGKDIPVIILTNLETMGSLNKALEGKAYDYIVKSDWKLEDIVNKVKERLSNG